MQLDHDVLWRDVIEVVNRNAPTKIERSSHPNHDGLKMVEKHLPISINNDEFNFLKNFIIKHKLKSAFELATGTGISSLSIAYGMQQNGGHLHTIDAYEEEQTQLQPVEECVSIYNNSQGYVLANYLAELFNVQESVTFHVGLFPEDCLNILSTHTFDFVLFDGPKNDDSFIDYVDILYPSLAETFAIFVHDTHVYNGTAKRHMLEKYGLTFRNAIPSQVYPLALITNIASCAREYKTL